MNVMWPTRWLFMAVFLPRMAYKIESTSFGHKLVHVKVTAYSALGKRHKQVTADLKVSEYFFDFAVAVRLSGGSHILCFMRCVCQYLWCM